MSTHNICFYGELMKIIIQLSSNTLLISFKFVWHLLCHYGHVYLYVGPSVPDCDICKINWLYAMRMVLRV